MGHQKSLPPALGNDFVLLTPTDILTRDETWISYSDMVNRFRQLPEAVPNDQLRAKINQYFTSRLRRTRPPRTDALRRGDDPPLPGVDRPLHPAPGGRRRPSRVDRRGKGRDPSRARRADRGRSLPIFGPHRVLRQAVDQLRRVPRPCPVLQGLHRVPRRLPAPQPEGKKPFSNEKDVQLAFGLVWSSAFDVNREVNNGRGPVDFKVSLGAGDKSLIEFKLASNTPSSATWRTRSGLRASERPGAR